ncbi:hypothetical protein ACFX13_007761 [Malus domestica]
MVTPLLIVSLCKKAKESGKSDFGEESHFEIEDTPPTRAPTLVDKGNAKMDGTEVAMKSSKSEQKEASNEDDNGEPKASGICHLAQAIKGDADDLLKGVADKTVIEEVKHVHEMVLQYLYYLP